MRIKIIKFIAKCLRYEVLDTPTSLPVWTIRKKINVKK
jgi:hypothetical protein